MSTKPEKPTLFKTVLSEIGESQGVIGKWMYHEDSKSSRKYVSRKNTGTDACTTRDETLIQLLKILKQDGYDLTSVTFDEDGRITGLMKEGKPVAL